MFRARRLDRKAARIRRSFADAGYVAVYVSVRLEYLAPRRHNSRVQLPFSRPAKPKQDDQGREHDRKVARCHKIVEEIQDRAERLQVAADALPSNEADALCGQVELLLEAADEMLDKVEQLEGKRLASPALASEHPVP